jgi:hypothetical protein
MELVVLVAFGIIWALFLPLMVLHAMVQADVSAINQAVDASAKKES